jgi:hypothetical protein
VYDGANIQQYTVNGTGAQSFTTMPDLDDATAFTIVNTDSRTLISSDF